MKIAQMVIFKLKEHEFGIDIQKVIEILNYEPIRPVPQVPEYIEGIINVRGTIYPIINLRKRLNMEIDSSEENNKIILLHLEQSKVGFLVDNVTEIMNLEDSQNEHAPEILEKNDGNCTEGIIKKDGRLIIVLNINALVLENKKMFLEGVSNEDDSSGNTK